MQHDIKFIGIFSAVAILAILFFGVSDVLGISLTSAAGVVVAVFATKRRNARGRDYQGKWQSIFRCSGLSALVFATVLTVKIYLVMVVTGITGSPYDVPDISLVRVFALSGLLVFTSVTVLLAGFDWNIFGLEPVKEN
jgi:small-conductance mechanosensitive channel